MGWREAMLDAVNTTAGNTDQLASAVIKLADAVGTLEKRVTQLEKDADARKLDLPFTGDVP